MSVWYTSGAYTPRYRGRFNAFEESKRGADMYVSIPWVTRNERLCIEKITEEHFKDETILYQRRSIAKDGQTGVLHLVIKKKRGIKYE
jgi:hypothetical protein